MELPSSLRRECEHRGWTININEQGLLEAPGAEGSRRPDPK